jgi:hypothetical protein
MKKAKEEKLEDLTSEKNEEKKRAINSAKAPLCVWEVILKK